MDDRVRLIRFVSTLHRLQRVTEIAARLDLEFFLKEINAIEPRSHLAQGMGPEDIDLLKQLAEAHLKAQQVTHKIADRAREKRKWMAAARAN